MFLPLGLLTVLNNSIFQSYRDSQIRHFSFSRYICQLWSCRNFYYPQLAQTKAAGKGWWDGMNCYCYNKGESGIKAVKLSQKSWLWCVCATSDLLTVQIPHLNLAGVRFHWPSEYHRYRQDLTKTQRPGKAAWITKGFSSSKNQSCASCSFPSFCCWPP